CTDYHQVRVYAIQTHDTGKQQFFLVFVMQPRTARSALFPYTTLFRSTVRPLEQCSRACAPGRTAGGGSPFSLESLWRLAIARRQDRKSTRLNSSHLVISYAVFCLKKKKTL